MVQDNILEVYLSTVRPVLEYFDLCVAGYSGLFIPCNQDSAKKEGFEDNLS